MNVACDSADLASALSAVMRAVMQRTNLPVLGSVLLEAGDDGLVLTATNLELGIRRVITADVAVEGGVAVPARLLAEFSGAIPSERLHLDLEQPGNRLRLRSSTFHGEIHGIPAEEFPPAVSTAGGVRLAIPAQQLVGAIADTLVAASTDEARPVLTGVHLEAGGSRLVLSAMDGHRLAIRRVELGADHLLRSTSLIVPARALAEVARLFKGVDGDLEMTVSPQVNQVLFQAPGVEVASRVIDGRFPDPLRLVPASFGTRVIVGAAELSGRLRALAPFAQSGGHVVRLTVTPRSIELSATTLEVGSAETELEAAVVGPETTVAFNARFLLDCPALATDEQVELDVQGPLGAFVVRRTTGDEYVYLFMPVRYPTRPEARTAAD